MTSLFIGIAVLAGWLGESSEDSTSSMSDKDTKERRTCFCFVMGMCLGHVSLESLGNTLAFVRRTI